MNKRRLKKLLKRSPRNILSFLDRRAYHFKFYAFETKLAFNNKAEVREYLKHTATRQMIAVMIQDAKIVTTEFRKFQLHWHGKYL